MVLAPTRRGDHVTDDTDNMNPSKAAVQIVAEVVGLLVFALVLLTGNFNCYGCGPDKDYLELWTTP